MSDTRICPYCAEEIKAAAIKCKHCGEALEAAGISVTRVWPVKWNSKMTVLQSDGSPRAFLDCIAAAVIAVNYPVTERNYTDLKLCFESRGISMKSWSGDITTILFAATDGGSSASFSSKGKPSGMMRVQAKVNAQMWVQRIIPGFGDLWTPE